MANSSYHVPILPTPARLWRQIESAQEREEQLDSLPGLPPDSSSIDPSKLHARPADPYDVGISEATNNTTFVPRNYQSGSTSLRPPPPPSSYVINPHPEPCRQQPTNTDHPQSNFNSPITSTPASLHLNHRSSRYPPRYPSARSPDASHIPQNQEAHQNREGMVILSSGSGTENDHPEPDILEDEGSDDSDRALRDLSNKSLGDLSLSVLDQYASELDIPTRSSKLDLPQQKNLRPQKTLSAPPQPCPSPRNFQSSHHGNSPQSVAQHDDPGIQQRASQLTTSQLTSPGVGRRNSFHAENEFSFEDIQHSLSRELAPDAANSKLSSIEQASTFQPETLSARKNQHRSWFTHNRTNSLGRVLKSNAKPAPSILPQLSARRPFVSKHLSEVIHDTSELTDFPGNQSNPSNNPPPLQLEESEEGATSHDLTIYPDNRHQNDSSSFSSGDQLQRFDNLRLNSFLHSLNSQLSEENLELTSALTQSTSLLEQIMTENQLLRRRFEDPQSSHDSDSSDVCDHGTIIANEVQRTIADHNNLVRRQSKFNSAPTETLPTSSSESSNRIHLLESQNCLLRKQLTQRDEEIKELRDQHCTQHPLSSSSATNQMFELKDHLANVQAQLSCKEEEVVKLQIQQVKLSAQHTRATAELRAQCEKLESFLCETQQALATARLQAEHEKNEYAIKFSGIKNHCTAVVAAQDEQLRSLSDKIKEARRLTNAQAKELAELKAHQPSIRYDPTSLLAIKVGLSDLLKGSGPQAVGPAIQPRIRLIQSKVEALIAHSTSNNHDKPHLPETTVEAIKQDREIDRPQQNLGKFRPELKSLTADSSETENEVNTLAQALNDSENARISTERELADLQAQLDIVEAKSVTQQSNIKALEVKLSQVMKSTFSDVSSLSCRLNPESPSTKHNSELAKAHEEIGRLKGLLEKVGDPATCEIQNLKIRALEGHRQELESRVDSLRHQASALMSTPSRSSLHFQSIISMRTPKTPGQILGNVTSVLGGDSGDETVIPMLHQIHELQQQVENLKHQLSLANKTVDEKLAKLVEAREDAVRVSSDAIAARGQVQELEEKCQILEQRLERLIGDNGTIEEVRHRLSNIACPECYQRFDANEIVRFRVVPETQELELTGQLTENDTQEHSTGLKAKFLELESSHHACQNENVELKRELASRNDQIEQIESDKKSHEHQLEQLRLQLSQTQGELESLRNRLTNEQESVEKTGKQLKATTAAKRQLEDQLEAVNQKLVETEAQLSEAGQARDSLVAEVRALHQAKADSHGLSVQIRQHQASVSKLESEKAAIAEQQDSLVEEISQLKRELDRKTHSVMTSEKSYHRVQAALEKQNQDLNKLKDELEGKVKEIEGLKVEKGDLLQDTHNLRSELINVRTEAQDLGRELQRLRDGLGAQRPSPPAHTKELMRMKDELFLCKKELNQYKSSDPAHQPNGRLSIETKESLDRKHNSECKGLLLRIRFLKLLFTRESTFRADLACQKRVIMVRLRGTEVRNQAIQLALSNFGLPYSLPPGHRDHAHDHDHSRSFTLHSTDTRSLKGIAIAVRAVCRLRILSKSWSKETRAKEKLKVAYQQVRGKELLSD